MRDEVKWGDGGQVTPEDYKRHKGIGHYSEGVGVIVILRKRFLHLCF